MNGSLLLGQCYLPKCSGKVSTWRPSRDLNQDQYRIYLQMASIKELEEDMMFISLWNRIQYHSRCT